MNIGPDRNLCVGCMACRLACDKGAIESQKINGFIYPKIDNSKCIDCGKCVTVCNQYHRNIKEMRMATQIVACQLSGNDKALINSTSGGFFYALGKYVIDKGGVVFGASYDESMQVVHSYVEKESELNKFSGSKYIQSDMGITYSQVKTFIENGRYVLFTGTPCQIGALYDFLGGKTSKLITADVICYGIASPILFRKCIEYYEKRRNKKVVDYRFRDKSVFGWSHTTKIVYGDGKIQVNINPRFDLFYRLWGKTGLNLRPSCYTCPYISKMRISDFTMGNYWGIEGISSKFDLDKGVSLVLLNTQKAEKIFESIKTQMITDVGSWDSVLKYQHGLIKRKTKTEPNTFYDDLEKLDITMCARKYDHPSLLKRAVLKMPNRIQSLILYPLKIYRIKKGGVRF